jgi:nitrite reductase (NO-forming)
MFTQRSLRIRLAAATAAAALAVTACSGGDDNDGPTATPEPPPPGVTAVAAVTLKNFKFEPSSFTFKTGDVIEFRLRTSDINHDFTVRDLNIHWDVSSPGRPRTERFTFAKAGEFRFICTVPGHEQAGMSGKITVQ